MPEQPKPATNTVQKSTLYGVAFVALAVGFLIGVVFSTLRTSTGPPVPQSASVPPAPVGGDARRLEGLVKETAQNPKNVAAWVDLGNLYFDTNQFDNSKEERSCINTDSSFSYGPAVIRRMT